MPSVSIAFANSMLRRAFVVDRPLRLAMLSQRLRRIIFSIDKGLLDPPRTETICVDLAKVSPLPHLNEEQPVSSVPEAR